MKKALLILGGTLILFGGVLAFAGKRGAEPVSPDTSNRELAQSCVTHGSSISYHIHPVLSIVINGERQLIPADVGITPSCMKAIHTHTPDGVIHIETPVARDFTVADFFANWEKTFTKDQVLDSKADAGHRIRVTVNGEEVDTYENTIMRDKDQIVIVYEATP